jgi:hypothetical protein
MSLEMRRVRFGIGNAKSDPNKRGQMRLATKILYPHLIDERFTLLPTTLGEFLDSQLCENHAHPRSCSRGAVVKARWEVSGEQILLVFIRQEISKLRLYSSERLATL